MKKLQMDQWERKEIYEFMSALSDPFYAVNFRVDVTNVYEYVHRRGISFYYAMIWLVTNALNDVPAFLQDIVDGEVVIRARRSPSFCDIRKDSEAFYIVNVLMEDDIDVFCEKAREKSRLSTSFYPKDKMEDEAWIYFSCLPWIDMTSVTNERDFDRNDTVPRISWGRFAESDGRKRLTISMEVNHRLIDGYHIGQFEKHLTGRIAAL